MQRLKVINDGSDVQAVELKGRRSSPESTYFRVKLPFGDVTTARVDGASPDEPEYWVHVRVNNPEVDNPEIPMGRVLDVRIDRRDSHAGSVEHEARSPLQRFQRARANYDEAEMAKAAVELAELLDDMLFSPELYHLAVRVGRVPELTEKPAQGGLF